MNIFTILNSLLFSKKPIDLTLDDENQFSMYMVNRWITMYSPDIVNVVNDTSNMYTSILNTKQDQFNWMFSLFPKLRFKKMQYIKKIKKDKEDTKPIEDNSLVIAKNHEISEREVKLYKELFPELI